LSIDNIQENVLLIKSKKVDWQRMLENSYSI
jgi:hypothetical protein